MVAGLVLASSGQPNPGVRPLNLRATPMYQWVLIPGGVSVPLPMPFYFALPVGRVSEVAPVAPRFRQEYRIVVEGPLDEQQAKALNKAIMDGVKLAISEAQEAVASVGTTKACKTDPKQVIDPVVTGF